MVGQSGRRYNLRPNPPWEYRYLLTTCCVFFATLTSATAVVAQQHAALIDEFSAAFNAHNPEKMASFVTDDFALYYVSTDGEAELATQGPKALAREMAQYFQALPTVASKLDQRNEVGDYVSFRETASWTTANGQQKSQASLAVYQIADGKIQRVWYYPAQ